MVRCTLCGAYFVDELIHGPMAIRSRLFYFGRDRFICPDCYDKIHCMSQEKYKFLGKGKGECNMMEKTETRKRLDTYIDVCLDCNGVQNGIKTCYSCAVLPKVIDTVKKIREERGKMV